MEQDLLGEILEVERGLRLSLEAEQARAAAMVEEAHRRAGESLDAARQSAESEAREAEAQALHAARDEARSIADASALQARMLLALDQRELDGIVAERIASILPDARS